MQFWFFFLFFFLIIQSQAAFVKLPKRSEIYNCTFKNTNKVSIIIIIIIIIITIVVIIIIPKLSVHWLKKIISAR